MVYPKKRLGNVFFFFFSGWSLAWLKVEISITQEEGESRELREAWIFATITTMKITSKRIL